jgi:hydrogenase expression/formation protein
LDLEGIVRQLYYNGTSKDQIIEEIAELIGSKAKAEAILTEIMNTEKISNDFIKELCGFQPLGYTAGYTGLGCRGEGDFLIHRSLAKIIENKGTIIDPTDQDDAGVVQVGEDYIIVSVDGMHSRLSHFPFLAGFHVARATIRDTIVMGSEPKALFSDIHLANDGDVAKIFEYTAGISVVSEILDIPLIAGSTLRIGGDLVLGDRLTGCVGCVGFGRNITPRRAVKPGDVLVMTEGSGGGTIATTALYNDFSNIVEETLNLKIINFGLKLLASPILGKIHGITDVTNGGLRGDAFELATTAGVRITLFQTPFLELIDPAVLSMLSKLEIDPLGVSIDSLLILLPEKNVDELLNFIRDSGIKANIIGCVESQITHSDKSTDQESMTKATTKECEVQLVIGTDTGYSKDVKELEIIDLKPQFREEPYTPIKKVVDIIPKDNDKIKAAIDNAIRTSLDKKTQLKDWMLNQGRV